jgi:hypothetical protein
MSPDVAVAAPDGDTNSADIDGLVRLAISWARLYAGVEITPDTHTPKVADAIGVSHWQSEIR